MLQVLTWMLICERPQKLDHHALCSCCLAAGLMAACCCTTAARLLVHCAMDLGCSVCRVTVGQQHVGVLVGWFSG